MQSISCAAHTFQLAIHDILNNDESKEIISDTRALAIKLRVPSMRRVRIIYLFLKYVTNAKYKL